MMRQVVTEQQQQLNFQVSILPNTIVSSFTHICNISSQMCDFLQICEKLILPNILKSHLVYFSSILQNN
jgi:hypothetical protein